MIASYKIAKPIARQKIKFKGHLPVVRVKIADQVLNLAIDSGAEINVFHHEWLSKLQPYIDEVQNSQLTGLDQKGSCTLVRVRLKLSIEDLDYQAMRTLFTDLQHLNDTLSGPDIDGLIGYEFLHQYPTGINFKTKTLTIWQDLGSRNSLSESLQSD